MTTQTLRLEQLRRIATRQRSDYFPFKLLETVPWLLLACAGRLLMNHPLFIFILLLIQCAFLIAFVLAAHRAIEFFGGVTALGRMSLLEQGRLARGILRRLLGLFLAAVLIALMLGMDKNEAPFFWLGFDALIHGRPGLHIVAWSAAVAVITYLMVVEKGLGRKPAYFAVLTQFASRAPELVFAMLLIVAFLAAMNALQLWTANLIQPIYNALPLDAAKNILRVGYLFIFAFVRLWVVIAILTACLRVSYRRLSAA